MTQAKVQTTVTSEIGQLKSVILHQPGKEVEDMTPRNAERALYSDILNLSVASREYAQFSGVLRKLTRTYEVKDLLREILSDTGARRSLLERICENEGTGCIREDLDALPPGELARQLIEGVPLKKDNLSRFLSNERFFLQPLHNFFFTRDASVVVGNEALIARMHSRVREREALIMEAIFDNHPEFRTTTVNPAGEPDFDRNITIEGGDLLIARKDILLMGIGARTSTQGVDFVIEHFKQTKEPRHIIVQELPHAPESFIHLDMVFTFLDQETCLIYEPVVLDPNRYRTVHIRIDNGEVKSINEEKDILQCLKKTGMDLKSVPCGGQTDAWTQEREQWHSGANFFALGPGKVMGYGRNTYTLEELNKNGFEILSAKDVISGKVDVHSYHRYAVTIDGSELARGGGGCRCMTMPLERLPVES